MLRWIGTFLAGTIIGSVVMAGPASAQQPEPWQLGLQPAANERMAEIAWLHDFVLVIIVVICLLVFGLLVYVMVRFNERANPNPSTTTHHTLLEVLWTIVPVFVLILIAIFSFPMLYRQDEIPVADLTIKAIGKQWYWTYEYPDHGNFTFDALMIQETQTAPAVPNGEPRLLGATNRVVVPVDAAVHLLVTAADVIHAWTIPAFGVKIDAVPGRVNETWFRATREGVYYGQCSELCGARHAYMPIAVEVVSRERFEQWVSEAQAQFGAADRPAATRIASDETR